MIKNSKLFAFILIIALSFALYELLFAIIIPDDKESWCNGFIDQYQMKNISITPMPPCIYNYSEILSYEGQSNQYFCMPNNSIGFHYERDTISPFLRFGGKLINNNAILDADFDFRDKTNFKIALLGDSVVEGWGTNASDSFAYLLEKKFENDHKRIAVYNAGTGGYWIGNIYIQLNKILNYDIDHIIIGLNEEDIIPDWHVIVNQIKIDLNEHEKLELAINNELTINYQKLNELCLEQITANRLNLQSNTHAKFASNRIYRYIITGSEKVSPSHKYNYFNESQLSYEYYINSLIEVIKLQKSKFTIIFFPTKNKNFKLNFIKNSFTKNNISFIDMDKNVEYLSIGCCTLSYPGDLIHPNMIGHLMIAESLYIELKDKIQ